jgi:hypothetical protein
MDKTLDMANYTKIFGKALELSKNLSPSGVGKGATLYMLKHSATRGYTSIGQVTKLWKAETEEESGSVVLQIAESAEATRALLLELAGFAINGVVYKLAPPNGRRPPLSSSKQIWFFRLNATGEPFSVEP